MYHRISKDSETVAPYYRLNTTPATFEQHLRTLNELGYRSIGLTEALNVRGDRTADSKNVVITFDDGFRDFYDLAFPLLKKHGHTATMFLPTSFIGERRRAFKNTDCLTWHEVRELRGHGMDFGSHTVSHPKLYELSWKEIEAELGASKDRIEDETGQAITSFAYPYAFPQEDQRFVDEFSDLLRGQNYKCCVTTVVGRMAAHDSPWRLKRLPVNDCDDRALFEAKLNGAYDWFGYPQIWSRKIRRWLRPGRRRTAAVEPRANGLPANRAAQKSTL